MKRWVKITLWSIFFIGMIVLIYLVNDAQSKKLLPEPEIIVRVDGDAAFITETELLEKLKRSGLLFEGQLREELNTEKIETFIQAISQIKSTDVFQHIDGSWKIEVELRKPIARIFNSAGETFYLDSEGNTMLVTPTHTARSLVITGHIPDRKGSVPVHEIINNDSLISIRKLDDIYRISSYVCNDPFFHAFLGQIHLEKNGDFVLVPLVGDQKIVFGSAYSEKEVEEKFKKLKIFYDEALPYEGWNTYSEISVKFDDQIVCKKKNSNE